MRQNACPCAGLAKTADSLRPGPPELAKADRSAPSRVSEYLSEQLNADRGYGGVLTHNPVYGPPLMTAWGRRHPFGLNVLAEGIPRGWRHPRKPRTEIGRNVSLFRSGMAWAGRTHNLDLDVFNYLGGINGEVAEDLGRPPLGYSELAGIAKSVERYRREWVAQGRFYSPEEVAAYARNGQRLSVQARRRNNRGRDEDMVVRAYAGESVSAIARVHGCLRNTVRDVLRRAAPITLSRRRR